METTGEIADGATDPIAQILRRIYGEVDGNRALERIGRLMDKCKVRKRRKPGYFSQEDTVLIAYGDSLKREGEAPLATFHDFARDFFRDSFSTIHFLPFFPYSSDDGFSVMDFFAIDPKLGSWENLEAIGRDFNLMFDLVLNHVSAKGKWFQSYLAAEPGFESLAIEIDPAADLSRVVRPRSLPLLTPATKASGKTVHVWTTFSADQIDLNYKSIDVLEKMVEVLLYYVNRGAALLRLDAIAYLWKELGTSCIHRPQTHELVKLFRGILNRVAPDVMIITETNVPHDENISYFGDGRDEAQMVYNFTLPPLLLHAMMKEDATVLSRWAKGLRPVSEAATFLNFTASHDGIGVRPLEGILSPGEIDELLALVRSNGGNVSYKRNPDGSQSPYELNITYVDAMRRALEGGDPFHGRRFLASQAIQYALPGAPATYIHSILGSRNWVEGVGQTGRARTINREKLQADAVAAELKNPETFRSRIFNPYTDLIKVRRAQPAFHPNAPFEIMDIDPRVFALSRCTAGQTLHALTNVSSKPVSVSLSGRGGFPMVDLISGKRFDSDPFQLAPYGFVWLSG